MREGDDNVWWFSVRNGGTATLDRVSVSLWLFAFSRTRGQILGAVCALDSLSEAESGGAPKDDLGAYWIYADHLSARQEIDRKVFELPARAEGSTLLRVRGGVFEPCPIPLEAPVFARDGDSPSPFWSGPDELTTVLCFELFANEEGLARRRRLLYLGDGKSYRQAEVAGDSLLSTMAEEVDRVRAIIDEDPSRYSAWD